MFCSLEPFKDTTMMLQRDKATLSQYIPTKAKAKAYHRRKVQAMTPIHKIKRVEFSCWALRDYGRALTGHSVRGRLISNPSVECTPREDNAENYWVGWS